MYEALVKSLRTGYCDHKLLNEAANAIEGLIEENEELSSRIEECLKAAMTPFNVLKMKAADAIEELNLIAESNRRSMEAWDTESARAHDMMPRWIPVTERLPETRSSILGQKSSKVIVAFQFDDETQGTDTAHTLNGNWVFEDRITVVNRTVTHWMPLPSTEGLNERR